MAKKETALATQGTTALQHDYGDDAVTIGQLAPGFDNQTSEDTAIPFITLLQPNSPVVADPTLLPGSGVAAGMWYNTVTKQLWKNPEGLLFVPALTQHAYIEYVPRDKGGGFVARHEIESEVVTKAKQGAKFGEYYVGENELTETFYVFGVACTMEEVIGMAIIPFKSSAIKCYKNMMTQLRSHTQTVNGAKKSPPLYAHLVKLTTEFKKNDEGSFWIPSYTPALGSVAGSCLGPEDDRFVMAKNLYNLINSGAAKVNYSAQDGAGPLPNGADGKPIF